MNIEIRKAVLEDCAGILTLMREFAEYEKLGDYLEIKEHQLSNVMFEDSSFVTGLVAFVDGQLAAYALFYPSFASFRGQRGIYLEDIFISSDHRHQGLGEAMLRAIAREARLQGAERIDFQVLDWNRPAINFYNKFGADGSLDESHYKFSDEAFARLAAD